MTGIIVHPECPFSEETFEFLGQLEKKFYMANKQLFRNYIEQPFQKLCDRVAAQLPGEILKHVEMELNEEPNFKCKNYECKLYQKSTRFDFDDPISGLFIDISPSGFIFGLILFDETSAKSRFIRNIQSAFTKEAIIQNTHLPDQCLLHLSTRKIPDNINPLGDWLKQISRQNSATKNIQANCHISPEKVLMYSEEQLASQIIQTFQGIFPLFLLATYNSPINDLRDYLDAQTIDWSNYYSIGLAKYKQGEYQDSINFFGSALEKSPNLAEAYSYRGQAKAALGDINGAVADYTHLLLIQPENAEAYNKRANAYDKLKDYMAAIKDYDQALDINPNLAFVYYNRGCTYSKIGNNQRAVEDLLKAAELFEQQGNIDNSKETQHILKTIQLDYSEPSFTEICENVRSKKGLRISKRILRRYHLALKSRKFVILSGISGTGKTWLTKAYADAVEAEYLLVPVAPNWTTNEDLLGYLNPIDNKYHDTDFSTFLQKAEEEYQQAQLEKRTPKPYHLVLDEMNLARVEYYFAKFLSAMEVRMREGIVEIQLASEKQVLLPPNLYFIGTVNVDETTHSFADKVYDRAQLIELEAPRQELYEHFGKVSYREMLMQIWDEVHPVAPFAFRVLDEIKTYLKEAEELDVPWQDALDEQLLQKILPKLKGADDRVGVALKAFVDIINDKDFPLSHKKATKMLDTFNQHGFTSYF